MSFLVQKPVISVTKAKTWILKAAAWCGGPGFRKQPYFISMTSLESIATIVKMHQRKTQKDQSQKLPKKAKNLKIL